MCEHCKSAGGKGRKIQDQERVEVLCKSAGRANRNNREAGGFGCCDWRQTCCGGGCCDVANCCDTGSSGLNVGYNNVSYNYRNEILPMGMGMGMNYNIRGGTGMRKNEELNRGPEMIEGETMLCGSQKYKYCSGGECYLNEEEAEKKDSEDTKNGETG